MDYLDRTKKITEINDKILDLIQRFEFNLNLSYHEQINQLHLEISKLIEKNIPSEELPLLFSHHICSTILSLINKK